MLKTIFMLGSKDLPNEMFKFERWYLRYHAAEVVFNHKPWLTNFIAYRPLPVIPEAVPYGYYNMRVIEAWFRSLDERPGGAGMGARGARMGLKIMEFRAVGFRGAAASTPEPPRRS